MAVNGAEEDGVENRAEPSLTHGKTVLGDGPADSEDSEASPAVEPTNGAAEAPPVPPADKPGTDSAPAAAAPSVAPPAPAARAYPSQNGSSATSPPVTPPAAPAPPVTSLMAPPPSTPGGGPSIQDSAMAAMASAASGARGVASRISASFASVTKPRSRPTGYGSRPQASSRPGQAPGQWQQAASGARGTRPAPQPGPQPRTALLSLQRIEPLSVMKFSSLISLVGFVVLFVAVAVVWYTLNKLGVFHKIEQTIGLVTYTKNHPGSNAAAWFSAKRVLGYTALIGAINAILFTALATIGAALYNLVTSLTGGIEVTLKETD
jgi:Transmembrane domain of unknown function (DUF3566)